jgi:MoaA/NifB/PqqE/SkfB family radical SAM enzyme
MEYLNDPIRLQFELSSMCNALCLGCVRTDTSNFSETKHLIPKNRYISFDTFKKILEDSKLKSAIELEFCGTIDDPLMHPNFLEFLDYARTVKDYRILIHTNASLRNSKYWKNLAEVLKKFSKQVVRFSIDGLEDTNHLYRQNTTWSKIMENAKSFIENGGTASWQYLIFPWNQHQVEQAKQLSISMGFSNFVYRHDRSIVTSLGLEKISFIKKENKKRTSDTKLDDLNLSLKNTVNNEISCDYRNRKLYFIGHDSRLWPCCFIHNGFFTTDLGKREILVKRLFDAYGSDDWNDLTKHSAEEILSHEFYSKDLVSSWSITTHGFNKTDRIHRCTEVCNIKKLEKLPIGNFK